MHLPTRAITCWGSPLAGWKRSVTGKDADVRLVEVAAIHE
jgi:hypothetical protein